MRASEVQLQKDNNYNQYQNAIASDIQVQQEKIAEIEAADIYEDDDSDRQTGSDGYAVTISAEAKELLEESSKAETDYQDKEEGIKSSEQEIRPNFTVKVVKPAKLPESAARKISTTIIGTGQFVQSTSGGDVLQHTIQKGYNPYE